MTKNCLMAFLVFGTMHLMGCDRTHIAPLDRVFVPAPAVIPIRSTLVLVVTPELKAAAWRTLGYGAVEAELGPAMIHYSEQMLRTISNEVKIMTQLPHFDPKYITISND